MPGLQSVSFSNPYSDEEADIERRRQMALLLQQQGMQGLPTESVGGYAVRRSPLEYLNKAAQQWSGAYNEREAREMAKALRERKQGDLTSDMTAIVNVLRGSPERTERPLVEMDDEGNQMPDVQFPARPAGQLDPSIIGQLRTPMMQQAAMQQIMAGMQPKAPLKAGPGEQFLDPNTFKPLATVPFKPEKPAEQPAAIREYEYARQQGFKGTFQDFQLEQRRAGANNQTVKVNSFLPASEEAQRDFMKSTRATYDQLKQAPVLLDSIERAKSLIPSAKGFMGPGGESLLTASKFLNNRLGMKIDTEGVKSAEELRTRIFFNIMDNLKKIDAQPSQQQQQIMQEALGRLGTDPNALPAVLGAFSDVIKGKVDLYNKEVQSAITQGVKFPYDPMIKLQGTGGSGGWKITPVN